MKFLFTAPRFHTNQAPIVKGLTERGHEVRYFVIFVGATEDHANCEPLVLKPSRTTEREKRRLEKTLIPSDVESAIGGCFIPNFPFLKQAFEDYMPDVVICREKTNLTLCVKALCDMHRIPCVLYDQEPLYQLKTSSDNNTTLTQRNSLLKRILLKLSCILNPDLKMLQQLKRISGFPTVRMTPVKYKRLTKELSEGQSDVNAYFFPFVAEQIDAVENRRYCREDVVQILTVGKYIVEEKFAIMIDAAKLLKKQAKFLWHITIIGHASNEDEISYYNQMIQAIREARLEEKIELKVNLSYHDMSCEYLKHDVFVLSSEREEASFAVWEAMAHGLPVISTDHNRIVSYITEGKNSYIFNTGDAHSLVQAITKMFTQGIEKLGKNARETAMNKYSWGYKATHLRGAGGSICKNKTEKNQLGTFYVPLVHTNSSQSVKHYPDIIENVRFLCVAKYRQYKNLAFLIKVFSEIKERDDWSLTIIGQMNTQDEKQYHDNLVKDVSSFGLLDRVTMLPTIDYKQMNHFYQEYDILILPSKKETYGMAVTEAMSNGLCVFSADTCGVSFNLIDGSCGIVFESNNAEALKNSFISILERKSAISYCGAKAHKYVTEEQSFYQYCRCLTECLNSSFGIKVI